MDQHRRTLGSALLGLVASAQAEAFSGSSSALLLAHADSAAPSRPPAKFDAALSAPDHHKVLLENDKVRVFDTRIAVGESTPVHAHPWPGALYVLSWSDFIRYDADGKVLLDSRTMTARPKAGAALWSDAQGPHSIKNVGDKELHVIAIELKSA